MAMAARWMASRGPHDRPRFCDQPDRFRSRIFVRELVSGLRCVLRCHRRWEEDIRDCSATEQKKTDPAKTNFRGLAGRCRARFGLRNAGVAAQSSTCEL